MAEPGDKKNGTSPKKYHHHPLFPHIPLEEAVRRGLAVPAGEHHDDEGSGRDNIQLKGLRSTKSTHNLGQDFYIPACEQNDRTNASSLTAGSGASELNKKSPQGITRYSGKPPKPLRKVSSLGTMRDVNNTKPTGSMKTEADKDVKEMRERVQETAQELRDRLGLHGSVPSPAPLNMPKKKLPKPTLARIDEDNCNSIGNQSTATDRISSATMLPMSPGIAQPYPSRLPRYKPQVKPHHPTQTTPATTQEEDILVAPAASSSLHALASASSPHSLTPTTANGARAQNKTLKATSSTPLLSSFVQGFAQAQLLASPSPPP
ncbi:hypothetical protein O1611_g10128 [Lasiodiplodia mahajangana]|uniref:Uncharacterized protein n=1 Tax=Lasiodiplodia mahajangana TaxID=1108764 RepID=A0ACC2J1U0_9PEZI|nr:hypothetical protein O1611_g10128 [Lasiodiplodia mahajangana]